MILSRLKVRRCGQGDSIHPPLMGKRKKIRSPSDSIVSIPFSDEIGLSFTKMIINSVHSPVSVRTSLPILGYPLERSWRRSLTVDPWKGNSISLVPTASEKGLVNSMTSFIAGLPDAVSI